MNNGKVIIDNNNQSIRFLSFEFAVNFHSNVAITNTSGLKVTYFTY